VSGDTARRRRGFGAVGLLAIVVILLEMPVAHSFFS
jgi:hypothetical protein